MSRYVVLSCLLALVTSGCSSPSESRNPVPRPTPMRSPTISPGAAATVAALKRDDEIAQNAARLGSALGSIYQAARGDITKAGGSARYWGDGFDRLEIALGFAPDTVGFGSFEYKLDCTGPKPPPICLLSRAFPPEEVKSSKELLGQLMDDAEIDFRVVGMADPVWKEPRTKHVYGGECGESECATDKGTIKLAAGMRIDSNEVLACLRALCVFAQSGLSSPTVNPKLRGRVAQAGSAATERRAELALFMNLSNKFRIPLWDAFRRQVGHSAID